MLSCSLCGKTYKHQGGLNNHIKRCGVGAASGAAVKNSSGTAAPDSDDITKSPFFTIPLTSFKPTANFTKEDLEELERRKQARLQAILKSQEEEKKKKGKEETKKKKKKKKRRRRQQRRQRQRQRQRGQHQLAQIRS